MEASVDISLYPLADEYIPAINEFIERVQQYPSIALVRNDIFRHSCLVTTSR
mgnify:CR=1 FL=1